MPISGLQKLENFFHQLGTTTVRESEKLVADAKTMVRVADAVEESLVTPPARFTFDAFKDWAGQSVGRVEAAGVAFATSHYMKEVIPGMLTRGSRVDFLTPADALMTSEANRKTVPRTVADLEARGFRSVVDLRLEGRGDQLPIGSALKFLRIPILDNGHPSPAQVLAFLDFIARPENQPCYVHCEAGVGRTGIMSTCALLAFGINPLPTPHRYTAAEAITESEKSGKMLPNQIEFIKSFARIQGYPLA